VARPAAAWRNSRRLMQSWSMRPPVILFFCPGI